MFIAFFQKYKYSDVNTPKLFSSNQGFLFPQKCKKQVLDII